MIAVMPEAKKIDSVQDFFDFPLSYKRIFGVSIAFKQGNKEDQHLSFETKVTLIRDSSSQFPLLEIDRYNLFINRQMPSYIGDKLAHDCGKVIYPALISLDKRFGMVAVKNQQAMLERWALSKEKIKEKHSGEVVLWYLNKAEKTLMDKTLLFRSLQQDLFLTAFCAPLYETPASLKKNVYVDLNIPIIPFTKPIVYKTEQKILQTKDSENTITIVQKGQVSDERSGFDLVAKNAIAVGIVDNKDKAKGTLDAVYELNSKTSVIESIRAHYTIDLPDNESREISLNAFYLKEKDYLL